MLNLFDPITVPGVEHVTIYHDDQDPNKFYMMPEMPTISRMAGDHKALQFSLVIFARDFHLMQDAAKDLSATETEGGLFSMTTELSVSEDDQKKILNYLRFQHQGLRPLFQAPGRFLLEKIVSLATAPITLSYPIWVDGKVGFSLLPSAGPTFIKAQEGSEKPSLMTTNLANYSALLGQEGVELVRSMLDKGMTPGSVDYSVSFMARVPSLTVKVTGNMSDIYQQIRQNSTPVFWRGARYFAFPGFNDIKDVETRITALKIEVKSTEFSTTPPGGSAGAAGSPSMADQIESKLNDLAFGIVQDILKNQFCTPSLSSDAAKDAASGSDSGSSDTPPTQRNWMKAPDKSVSGTLDVEISYDKNLPVTKNPGCSLLTLCTAEEAKKRIVAADLSDPFFQILDVSVQVTADFENDPIAAIKVFLDYDQTDEATGMRKTESQEYMFTTGKEVYRFQTVMGKAKDGTPKDSYSYRSEIIYKAAAQPQQTPAKITRDRALIIGYNQLSCVRVQAALGAVPTDVVQKIQAHFQYPNLNLPSAQKDVFLGPDHPSDSWFTYTNGNPSVDYQVQLTYLLNGGQQLKQPVQTANSSTFIINSPFSDNLRITFAPQGQFPPIASILLSVRYEDKEHNYIQEMTHTFTSLADSWLWTVPILDRTKRSFQYRVMVTNTDGTSNQGNWVTATDTTLLIGQTAQQMLEVDIVPSLLDLQTEWKLVIARLHYDDPANQINEDHIFQITGANAGQPLSWKIPLKNPAMKSYTYRVDAYGFESGKNKSLGPITTEDPLLVIQL